MIYGFKALLWGGMVAVAMSFGMTAMPVPSTSAGAYTYNDATSTSDVVNSTRYQAGYDLWVCKTNQDFYLDNGASCSTDCGEEYLDKLEEEVPDIKSDPDWITGRDQAVVDTLPPDRDRSTQCINGPEGCPCAGGCCP